MPHRFSKKQTNYLSKTQPLSSYARHKPHKICTGRESKRRGDAATRRRGEKRINFLHHSFSFPASPRRRVTASLPPRVILSTSNGTRGHIHTHSVLSFTLLLLRFRNGHVRGRARPTLRARRCAGDKFVFNSKSFV